ncbi:MAG: ribbon-helix-helix domain-containing protein [Promethearchaeota archaeon]
MKLISLYVPDMYITLIDELVEAGFFPNRSEAIRVAIRDLIRTENSQLSKKVKEDIDPQRSE